MADDAHEIYKQLLCDLAEHIGLQDIDLLLNSQALLIDDVEIGIVIDEEDPEAQNVYTVAEVATPNHLSKERLLELLEANSLGLEAGGGALSIHPDTGAVYLSRTYPINVAVSDLAVGLDMMIDPVKTWAERLTFEPASGLADNEHFSEDISQVPDGIRG